MPFRIPHPRCKALGLALLLGLSATPPSPAQQVDAGGVGGTSPGTVTQQVQFDQKLGDQVPMDVALVDESGREVRLGEFFGSRPVIVNLVYYQCPMLCGEVLRGLARSLKPLDQTVGVDFDIVTVSIDPTEGPELAAFKKAATVDYYGRPEAAKGWHFLTSADREAIDRLAESIGFTYIYNPRTKQYAHAAGVVLTTPDGRVSRYYFGFDHSPRDLKAGLEAAARSEVGSPISKLLLLCYDYDPTTGKYTITIMSLLRVLGVATLLGMVALVAVLSLRERSRRPAAPVAAIPE